MNKKYSDFSLKLKESILNNISSVVNKELENLSQEIEKDMDKFDNLTKLYNLIMQLPIYNELKEENNRLRLENNHLKNKFGINLSIEEKDNQNKNILLDSIFEDNKSISSVSDYNSDLNKDDLLDLKEIHEHEKNLDEAALVIQDASQLYLEKKLEKEIIYNDALLKNNNFEFSESELEPEDESEEEEEEEEEEQENKDIEILGNDKILNNREEDREEEEEEEEGEEEEEEEEGEEEEGEEEEEEEEAEEEVDEQEDDNKVIRESEEEEEEEEEFEITEINGKEYFTNGTESGDIFEVVDDDLGEKVGYYNKNGIAIFI